MAFSGAEIRVFTCFFPISGRRPEIPVLAGGQGRKNRVHTKGVMQQHATPGWTFRIYFIFFLLGEGEGRVRAGGFRFFIENPRNGGGGFQEGGGGAEGREHVWEIFLGGFFLGAAPRLLEGILEGSLTASAS